MAWCVSRGPQRDGGESRSTLPEAHVTKRTLAGCRMDECGTRNHGPRLESLPVDDPRASPRLPITDVTPPPSLRDAEALENPIHCRSITSAASTRSGVVARIGTHESTTETPYRLVTEHFSHHGQEREQADASHANGNSPERRYSPIYGKTITSSSGGTT
jgi:hypothetical protein